MSPPSASPANRRRHPRNQTPCEKKPVRGNARAEPCVNSALTGKPNCVRLHRAPAPEPRRRPAPDHRRDRQLHARFACQHRDLGTDERRAHAARRSRAVRAPDGVRHGRADCSLGVMPTDASMTGKWTSLKSVPAHRMIENVNDVAPGARRLASSSHAIGTRWPLAPVVGLGSGLLLGGALLCAFPCRLLLPCA